MEVDICDVVVEANMVEDNPMEWWYNTCATTHICLITYHKNKTEEQLFMGNTTVFKIEGKCKVVLKLNLGCEITL